jgi:hypothetical protein
MRNYLILLLLFLTGQLIYSQNTETYDSTNYRCIWDCPNSKTPIENSTPLKCKIFRIKKIDKAYIIDIIADNQEYVYTIISLKSEKQNLEKIKRGKQYDFVLFAYYPFIIVGDPMYAYYTVEGVRVRFKGDFQTGQIVTTPNLKGLYYIPPEVIK